jgi:membrane protease YdiL (CAAX protease family)
MGMTGRLAAWLAFVVAFIGLSYGSRAAEGNPPHDALYQYSTAVGGFVQYGVMLCIVLAITRGPAQRELLALHRPRSWPRAIGLSLVVIVAVYILTLGLEPLLHAGKEQGLTPSRWESSKAGPYAANFVLIAGVAPFVEELIFRGAGYSLLERFGVWVAILAVGITFGLMHGLVEGLVVLSIFGAALAWLRSRTGSVYPCIAVHALFNGIALVVAVTT